MSKKNKEDLKSVKIRAIKKERAAYNARAKAELIALGAEYVKRTPPKPPVREVIFEQPIAQAEPQEPVIIQAQPQVVQPQEPIVVQVQQPQPMPQPIQSQLTPQQFHGMFPGFPFPMLPQNFSPITNAPIPPDLAEQMRNYQRMHERVIDMLLRNNQCSCPQDFSHLMPPPTPQISLENASNAQFAHLNMQLATLYHQMQSMQSELGDKRTASPPIQLITTPAPAHPTQVQMQHPQIVTQPPVQSVQVVAQPSTQESLPTQLVQPTPAPAPEPAKAQESVQPPPPPADGDDPLMKMMAEMQEKTNKLLESR